MDKRKLPLDQQVEIRVFTYNVNRMSLENAQATLSALYKEMLIQDNRYKNLIGNAWKVTKLAFPPAPDDLTLNQDFRLQAFIQEVKKLTASESRQLLCELFIDKLTKEALYEELLHNEWSFSGKKNVERQLDTNQ